MSTVLKVSSCFALVTAPLALFGSHPVDIRLGGIKFYEGRLQDVATSYLAIAGLASLGLGTVGQGSSRRKEEDQGVVMTPVGTSSLKVPHQGADISRQSLRQNGLDFFLDGDPSPSQTSVDVPQEQNASRSSVLANQSVEEEVVQTTPILVQVSDQVSDSSKLTNDVFSFQPELPQDVSESFVLEGWAEAFLSDEPLGELQSLSDQSVPEPSHRSTVQEPFPIQEVAAQIAARQSVETLMERHAQEEEFVQDAEPLLMELPSTPAKSPLLLAEEDSTSLVAAGAGEHLGNVHNIRPRLNLAQVTPASPVAEERSSLPSVVPTMPAAQAYLGFAHLAQTTGRAYSTVRDVNAELEALEQLQAVREQIQVLSTQMEMIQTHLYPNPPLSKRLVALPSPQPQKPTYTVSTTESSAGQSQFQTRKSESIERSAIAS